VALGGQEEIRGWEEADTEPTTFAQLDACALVSLAESAVDLCDLYELVSLKVVEVVGDFNWPRVNSWFLLRGDRISASFWRPKPCRDARENTTS
jgi:hypothetical protein